MDSDRLIFRVVPGEGIGHFRLGMSLHEVLIVLRGLPTGPGGADKYTSLHFSRSTPLDKPIVLEIKNLGLKLRFEPKYQKLLVIDVYDVAAIPLDFQGLVVGGQARQGIEAGVLKSMYEVLGVTHSGFRRDDLGKDTYCLQYPGLLVAYTVPAKESVTGIPLVLSNGASPPLVRVTVHEFDFGRVAGIGRAMPATPKRIVEAIVSDDRGVEVYIKDSDQCLMIGVSTSQDVLTCLGPSSRLFFKQEEPIGTKARRKERQNEPSAVQSTHQHQDYFLNYFEQGLDILLDGATHVLKKVIMRTNLIAHPAFGQYEKCAFSVRFAERLGSVASGSRRPGGSNASGKARKPAAPPPTAFDELLGPGATVTEKTATVSCDEPWQSISKKLDIIDEKPMVNEKADQPFGPCYLFGYRHAVFEVDKASMHVASLTLF
jgi:hypothetical protein